MVNSLRILALPLLAMLCQAQTVSVRPAAPVSMPAEIEDGNSPAVWQNGTLNVYTSTGIPMRMTGANIFGLAMDTPPQISSSKHLPLWIESIWRDDDGTTYAWYHHEARACNDELAVPSIGALVSHDGGVHFDDLGIVLSSGDPIDCGARNGFFATGHGDFSVVLDQHREYFYFFYTNYGGAVGGQGIAMARLRFDERANPVVWKYYRGEWNEPGVGGKVTPLFQTRVAWQREDTDSFWGPAVHWNTSINRYVMLLNRACCESGWPQEGIYTSIGFDPEFPGGWSWPKKLMDGEEIGFAPGYYPQAFGTGVGETDTIAGKYPRLFIKGFSRWELSFDEEEPPPPDPDCDPCAALPAQPSQHSDKMALKPIGRLGGRHETNYPLRRRNLERTGSN
jgi:hypothetical protein